MPFVYSLDGQRTVQVTLTRNRLTSYVIRCNGNLHDALLLYERNTRTSESLYGVIQAVEVTARNFIHGTMAQSVGRSDWYNHVGLERRELGSIRDAKDVLLTWHKKPTSNGIISELTFGFWVRLMAPAYEKTLWVPHLSKAFPELPKADRVQVFDRFEAIRKLRNRIAHHEPIFARDLKQDYNDLLETIGWFCPVTQRWVDSTNSFTQRGFH